MISAAARFALELWCELHPDTSYLPDPHQLRLPLPAPPSRTNRRNPK